jgi:hypothetical protein
LHSTHPKIKKNKIKSWTSQKKLSERNRIYE